MRAVAYWTSTHSALFGLQMPTRSPGSIPAAMSALASSSTAASSCAYVRRTSWKGTTSASWSGKRAAVRGQVVADRLADQGTSDVPFE